jgi:hypothetical protein
VSLQTRVTLRRYSDGTELNAIDDRFVRRDYDRWEELDMDLTTVKSEVVTNLSAIEFVYIRRTGDEATVSVYKNLSPESWDFDDVFMVFPADSLTNLSLEASVDTTVHIYMAGS